MIKKIIAALTQQTAVQRVTMIDAHGYDGFPSLACLEVGVPKEFYNQM